MTRLVCVPGVVNTKPTQVLKEIPLPMHTTYTEVYQTMYYNAYNDIYHLRVGLDSLEAQKYALTTAVMVCVPVVVNTKPTQVLKKIPLPMHATYTEVHQSIYYNA